MHYRLLVTGGRDYTNKEIVWYALDHFLGLFKPFIIIHGDAAGADKLADRWAVARHVPVVRYAADWKRLGRAAGMVRNKEMLAAQPDRVLAFPGGTGTRGMCRIARQAGVPVFDEADMLYAER